MHLSVYVYVACNVGSCSGSMKVMHCCLVANKIYNQNCNQVFQLFVLKTKIRSKSLTLVNTNKHVDRQATRTLTGKLIEDMYMCMQSRCVQSGIALHVEVHSFALFVLIDCMRICVYIYICVYVSVWCMSSYMFCI